MKSTRRTIDEFIYPHPFSGDADSIKIVFVDGIFSCCHFSSVNGKNFSRLSRDDWRILGAISEEISLIEEQLEKEKRFKK
jgi:hypothetical protein